MNNAELLDKIKDAEFIFILHKDKRTFFINAQTESTLSASIPRLLAQIDSIKGALVRKFTSEQRRIMRQGASDDSGSVGEGNAVRSDSAGPGKRPA